MHRIVSDGAVVFNLDVLTEYILNEVKWKSLSRVRLFATPWTIQSMEFSGPEYWSEFPFPPPGEIE